MRKTLALAALLCLFAFGTNAQTGMAVGGGYCPTGLLCTFTTTTLAANTAIAAIGQPAQTYATDLNQVSGGSVNLAFATVAGLATGQVAAGTSITAGDTISALKGTVQTVLSANGVSASGQKVLATTSTTGCVAGMQVVDITTPGAVGDGNVVNTVQAGVSVTLVSNLTGATVNADVIHCDPVVVLSAASTATIASGASINFYANTTTLGTGGSVVVNGGASVNGNLYVGGQLNGMVGLAGNLPFLIAASSNVGYQIGGGAVPVAVIGNSGSGNGIFNIWGGAAIGFQGGSATTANCDTSIVRISAGVLGIGAPANCNASTGSITGSLSFANGTVSSLTAGNPVYAGTGGLLTVTPPSGAPVINTSAVTCGTGCASITGSSSRFTAITGTAVTSVTVNFGTNWGATPVCTMSTNSLASAGDISAVSVSSITFGLSVAVSGGTIYAICAG